MVVQVEANGWTLDVQSEVVTPTSTTVAKMGHSKRAAVSSGPSHGSLSAMLRRFVEMPDACSPPPTMATIHPSRLGLVPQDSKASSAYTTPEIRGRAPPPHLERRRSPSPTRSRDRYGRDSRGRDGYNDREGDRRDGARSGRTRARADDYFDGEGEKERGRERERSRSGDRRRDREREDRREERRGDDRPRRPSPEYSEYRRPSPPAREGSAPAPWRQQENMYPGRRGGLPPAGGSDFLERCAHLSIACRCELTSRSRRQQREASSFSIWPPSPKAPARSYVALFPFNCMIVIVSLAPLARTPSGTRSRRSGVVMPRSLRRTLKTNVDGASARSVRKHERRRKTGNAGIAGHARDLLEDIVILRRKMKGGDVAGTEAER